MIGPPGAGKSLLASCLPGILPDMTPGEALEASMVQSIAGMLEGGRISRRRPFRDPHHSASIAALTGGSQCEPAALAAIRDRVIRLRATDACREKAEEYRHDRNDLVQQTRDADAAAAQVVVANQGLWMGWFQTIGGFITLAAAIAAAIYARDAAKHTDRGATATDNAVKEAQRIGEAQVRCYLSGKSAQIGFTADERCMVNCTVGNSGQSPARRVAATGVLYLLLDGNQLTLNAPDAEHPVFHADIPAGGDAEVSFCLIGGIGGFDFGAVSPAHRALLRLDVEIEGTDVFGVPVKESDSFKAHPFKPIIENEWVDLERSARVLI